MALLGLALAAQDGLKLELKAYKVLLVEEDGKTVEKLVEALEVAPGDVLEWVLTAKNEGKVPLRQVALTIPIPKNTVYIPGTAKPLVLGELKIEPLFSYDGKRFARPPLKKKIKVKVGDRVEEKEVVVPPEEYTHVRWVVPELAPGQVVKVSLRTRVR